jgi:hypothetical protein
MQGFTPIMESPYMLLKYLSILSSGFIFDLAASAEERGGLDNPRMRPASQL